MQSLSFLFVIERLRRTTAFETGVSEVDGRTENGEEGREKKGTLWFFVLPPHSPRGFASRSLQSLNNCGRKKKGTTCSLPPGNPSVTEDRRDRAKVSGTEREKCGGIQWLNHSHAIPYHIPYVIYYAYTISPTYPPPPPSLYPWERWETYLEHIKYLQYIHVIRNTSRNIHDCTRDCTS